MTDQPKGDPPVITVTLVHGTFARDAQWTDKRSDFSKSISRAVPGKVLLTRFKWSGLNSHRARLHAGEELAAYLRNLTTTYPTAKHHVIAHSHGGNVVMYAMRDKSVAERMSSLVCLATPFLTLERRRIGPSISVLREFPNPLFACIFATFLSFAFGTLGTSLWVVPGLMAIGVVYLLVRKFTTFLSNRLVVRFQKFQDRMISQFSLPELECTPVLVVQAHRDEAAWYLNLVDWIANLPYMLWSPRFVFWLAWGWIFLSLPWVLAMTHLSIFGATAFELGLSLEGTLFTAFTIGLYALGLAVGLLLLFSLIAQGSMAVWAIIFRGHALGFGERNIFENWLIHIAANADPQNAHNFIKRSFVVSGAGLRHAVYRDETVRKNVADWIAKIMTQNDVRTTNGEEK